MATIPTVTNFDLTRIPVEGTQEFRANASYVWSTIPSVITSMNNSIEEMNNLADDVDTVLAYTQEATSQAEIATQQATAAANSASAASTSETNATTSEANALTSENNAKTSETNAANSAASVDADNILHTIGSGLANEAYTKEEIDTKPTGFKNYIINGGFDVWQRGESFDDTASLEYNADRFNTYIEGTDYTVDVFKETTTSNVKWNVTRITTKGSLSYIEFNRQSIERSTVFDLIGKEITLSMKLRSSDDSTQAVLKILKSNETSNSIVMSKSVTLDTTMKVVSLSGIIPESLRSEDWSGVSNSLIVAIAVNGDNVADGTYFQTEYVDLEEGSVATPFERRPYGLELSLCQRYYVEMGSTYILPYTSAKGFAKFKFPVPMRISPTLTRDDIGNADGNFAQYENQTNKGVEALYNIDIDIGSKAVSLIADAEL